MSVQPISGVGIPVTTESVDRKDKVKKEPSKIAETIIQNAFEGLGLNQRQSSALINGIMPLINVTDKITTDKEIKVIREAIKTIIQSPLPLPKKDQLNKVQMERVTQRLWDEVNAAMHQLKIDQVRVNPEVAELELDLSILSKYGMRDDEIKTLTEETVKKLEIPSTDHKSISEHYGQPDKPYLKKIAYDLIKNIKPEDLNVGTEYEMMTKKNLLDVLYNKLNLFENESIEHNSPDFAKDLIHLRKLYGEGEINLKNRKQNLDILSKFEITEDKIKLYAKEPIKEYENHLLLNKSHDLIKTLCKIYSKENIEQTPDYLLKLSEKWVKEIPDKKLALELGNEDLDKINFLLAQEIYNQLNDYTNVWVNKNIQKKSEIDFKDFKEDFNKLQDVYMKANNKGKQSDREFSKSTEKFNKMKEDFLIKYGSFSFIVKSDEGLDIIIRDEKLSPSERTAQNIVDLPEFSKLKRHPLQRTFISNLTPVLKKVDTAIDLAGLENAIKEAISKVKKIYVNDEKTKFEIGEFSNDKREALKTAFREHWKTPPKA